MIKADNFKFSSATTTILVIVLSFAATIVLWLFTNSRADYFNDAREQVRILTGSWHNLEREVLDVSPKPASDVNTVKSAYNLVIFDVRLNGFLKSTLIENLSRSSDSLAKRFNEINTEWRVLREKIESRYAMVLSGNALSESELSTSRLHFSVLLDGLADIISDKIIQQTVQVRLIVFTLSMIIIISVLFFINQVHKKLWPHQLELKNLLGLRTSEVEEAKTAAQNARLQVEQVNRQLQASVNHANLISQRALETDRSKNEFVANISREIRIPMNAIMGFSEMLSEEALTDQQNKQVGLIRESSRQLLQLINDMLDYSRIETGRLEVETADYGIENILASIESSARGIAAEKKLQFQIVRSGSLPEFIHTDLVRFKQCLMNLINNAIEATDKGTVAVRVSHISAQSSIRFDVEDMGSSIPSEKLNQIFEPFSQINPDYVGARRSGCNGLRLTIARHLAELLGGSLAAAAATGSGNVLTLVLPLNTPPAKPAQRPSVDIANRPVSVPRDDVHFTGKVLVVEDTPTNQILISLILKKLGIEPVIVENGLLAVQKATAENFDVILMDMQMPVMNGYEAARQLRQKGIKTPIVAQTACAMKGDDEKCLTAGCSDYIVKPIDRKKLVGILAKYLQLGDKKPVAQSPAAAPETKQTTQPQQTQTAPPAAGEMEIDWRLLIERIGSEQLIGELMPIFIKDNDERIKSLEKAVAENDDKEVKFYAHSIKGASGTIGAAAIAELARRLENAGRDSNRSQYKPLFDEIKTRFTRLLEFVSQDNWQQIASSQQGTKKT